MIHITDDKLLEHALDISTDEVAQTEIAEHVAACSDCRARLEGLRKDMEIIGGIRPAPPLPRMPYKRKRMNITYRILRAAALVILGIAVGFIASRWIDHGRAVVLPAYVTLSPLPDSVSGFVAADATGTSANYYRQILERP